ncbi:hypothetical protein DPEC_G00123470 [Dallia pectoralis]|uniref:Uncharacterized protein n=1 Tax=Dallia pectoralis TaxID=75939 RepID=A0ACC2GR83_DALPE|nr:hypothetical protein DPEC_G00123470 [Dallia pectoralis]
MANIIRHQAMQRHSVAWAESLRYRKPEFEGMGGLRRVTLNCNTLVGDRGAAAIAKELTEDFWVKAVDLQKCGLSNKGTHALLEAVKFNTTVCVLDIRGNPLVDKDLVKTVIERVLVNGQSSKYSWIKPPSLKENPQKPPGLKRKTLGNTAKGKATFRMGPRRLCSSSRPSPDEVQPPHPSSSRCIPWRTAERAGRQRGISLENTVDKQSFEGGASVRVTLETESEEEDEDGADSKSLPAPSFQDSISVRQYKRLQVELEECRLRLAEERRARVKTDRRLMEYELENARLRSINFSLSEALQVQTTGSSSVLEEDAVLDSIESSFRKFHAFLDLLKDAGLGQLASIAGIDHSDFGPVGRPQLSSTVGQPPAGTGTETVAGDQDTGEKVDPALAGCEDPSAPSEGHPNGFPPGGPATLTGLLPEGDPREVPRIAANDQASKTCVEETGGENQQRDASLSKPEGRQAKDSYSGHSQGSFANVSQRGSVSHHRNGDGVMPSNFSDRGNGSHGYSFKYCNDSPANSSILTDDSYSNDWHGDSSVMSSLSERGISVGSFGSKASGGGMAKS